MPINGRCRFRHKTFHSGQQSPTWGIIEQFGPRSRLRGTRSRSTGNIANAIIRDVLCTVSTGRNRPSVRPLEEPAVPVVAFDHESTFVHQLVMLRTQEHQVIEAGFTSGRPVLDMMRIDKACVVTTGECTDLVSGTQCPFDRSGNRARLATDIQGLAVLIFTNNHCMPVTAKSFNAFDGEVCRSGPWPRPLPVLKS